MGRGTGIIGAFVVAAASGLFAAPASAQGVEFTVKGELGAPIPQGPWSTAQTLDPVEVTVCLDPAALDTDPTEGVGVYPGAASVSVEIAGIQAESVPGGVNVVTVLDNDPFLVFLTDVLQVEFELEGGILGRLRLFISGPGPDGPGVLVDGGMPSCDQIEGFEFVGMTWELTQVPATAIIMLLGTVDSCGACALPECFLVIGSAPGSDPFTAVGHAFTTQVAAIEQSHAVLLDDIPEFVIWEPPPSMRASVHGLGGGAQPLGGSGHGNGHGNGQGHLIPLEDDPLPQVFYAQVLMWNPQVFPSNPEQSTHGLAVIVTSAGRVFTAPYGTSDGDMTLWAETEWNDEGQKILRLPFSIPGF